MTNTDERRWRQRLESFGAALARLDEACEQDSYTNLERAGLVQTFAFSYELGWKVLKDLLFHDGHDLNGPARGDPQEFRIGLYRRGRLRDVSRCRRQAPHAE